MRRPAQLVQLSAPCVARRRRRPARHRRLRVERELLRRHARQGRRSSSRSTSSSATPACSRSATSASSRSGRGRQASSRCRRRRSRRSCRTSCTFLRAHTVGNVPSLSLAALVGGVFALVVGLPLMRLSGLAAGIATFGVLEITHNVLQYYERIGPGLNTFSSVPETTGLLQASIGALIAICVAFALSAEPLRAHAARDARGLAGRLCGRHLRLPSAARSLRRSPARSPDSPAASTSTCCR